MKVLELFSGTGSVGTICNEYGWDVVSLDLKNADINCNILDWDHTIYNPGDFDIIWASPPCDTFSNLRCSWIGRKLKCHNGQVCTHELLQKDIDNIGLPILRKTEQIIDYLKPKYYFIENPQTGKMKNYIDRPYWGYQKRTRIWTNIKGFDNLLCNKLCGQLLDGLKHVGGIGCSDMVLIDGKYIRVYTKALREKYRTYEKKHVINTTKNDKYRIPPNLIKSLFLSINI
jgi:site-specific DNA-cytosine methylase